MTTDAMTVLKELADKLSARDAEHEYLEERVSDLAMKLDEVGWEKVGWDDDSGLDLDALKSTSATLTDMIAQSPLIKRGAQLRYGYVFGQGMNIYIDPTLARVKKFMEDANGDETLFGSIAQEALNAERYTAGNLFILRAKDNSEIVRVPLTQITGVITDPNSAENIRYIKRKWTEISGTTKKDHEVWYRCYDYTPVGKTPTRVSVDGGSEPVDSKYIMHVHRPNRLVGHTWGLPDAYPAIPWTLAYTEYLKDNSKLVAAYAKIAYKVSTASKAGGQNIAAQVSQPGAGGFAAYGLETNLTAIPATGSTVSFQNGRPLASMVAAAIGVSVVALLADPGAAGSSYGSAQTLDAPTVMVMVGLQNNWKEFFLEILEAVRGGSEKKIDIDFPSIDADPQYRALASLQSGFQTGALWQDEYRAGYLKIADVEPLHDTVPKPTKFTPTTSVGGDIASKPVDTSTAAAQPGTVAGAQPTNANTSDGGETDNATRRDTQSTGDSGRTSA